MVEKRPREQRVSLIDEETGEQRTYIVDEDGHASLTTGGGKKKNPVRRYSSAYAVLFANGARRIASDRGINGGDIRVLMAIVMGASLDGKPARVHIATITEITGITAGNVGNSIAVLAERGYVTRPKRGWISLDPTIAWRGPVHTREEALAAKIASAYGAEEE